MESQGNGLNRRRSERKNVAYTFTYSIEEPYDLRVKIGIADDRDVLMLNLSDLCMAIITKDDLPVGAKLLLEFNLMNLNLKGEERFKHIKVSGEVMSNIILPNADHRIGICFTKISEEDKIAIGEFVKFSNIASQ